jgi:hypothetical protein
MRLQLTPRQFDKILTSSKIKVTSINELGSFMVENKISIKDTLIVFRAGTSRINTIEAIGPGNLS